MEGVGALEGGDPERVGRYRLVGRLGAGGMGRVYLARSPGGRAVAVKVVRAELSEDPGFRERFAREVAAAGRVNSFFTAGVVDADPQGSPPWLATAYVPGPSLAQAVLDSGPWPERSVTALAAALAEALEAIHASGLVHRDLKPSNVLIAADGPRVIDFGISVAAEGSALTQTGMVVGTPGFMAPEQLTGGPVGPAADVFALGAVLAYAATGEGPFGTGASHAVNYRAVHEEPRLGSLPDGLREVVLPCLAKEPGQRPRVPELLERLEGRSGEEPAPGRGAAGAAWLPEGVAHTVRLRQEEAERPPGPRIAQVAGARTETSPRPVVPPMPDEAPRPGRSPRRSPLTAITAAVAVLALTVGLVLALDRDDDGEPGAGGGTTPTATGGTGEETSGPPPGPVSGQLAGAGSIAQDEAQQVWSASFTAANPEAQVTYEPSGAGAGWDRFLTGQAEFTGREGYLGGRELDQAAQACPELVEIPVHLTLTAVVVRLDGVGELSLRSATLAGIFSGGITFWNDPAIAADNPSVTLPDTPVVPVHRSDTSEVTGRFTDWLNAGAPRTFPFGATDDWPYTGVGLGAEGALNLARTVNETPGAIGYVDPGVADQGLVRVALGAGGEAVAPTPEAGVRMMEEATPVSGRGAADLAYELPEVTEVPGAYPLLGVSYVVTCAEAADEERAALLRAYLSHLIGEDAQEEAADATGSVPLPDSLRADLQAAIGTIG
ncbi:substrate-binding domain-containing protein [Streptomyces sp. DSM 44917]|uniref:Substrate-binding domain-containing protein n=1 Tax=Streptomyces boetiae TaxID=3075541 RepID=A0ABU2LDS2_9ACTN|nr:substrate-binding domain-containing protein [Streptomyces sp. DSM 44917]MDT0309721.1 substrate-binding domain-containing protein [Streptomyces sp. DSM 44917]